MEDGRIRVDTSGASVIDYDNLEYPLFDMNEDEIKVLKEVRDIYLGVGRQPYLCILLEFHGSNYLPTTDPHCLSLLGKIRHSLSPAYCLERYSSNTVNLLSYVSYDDAVKLRRVWIEKLLKHNEMKEEPKMKKRRHIAIDLELEQGKNNPQTPDSKLDAPKIIQLGYVIYEVDPFVVITKKSYFIHLGVPLSAFIKKLTRISDDDLEAGSTLISAYTAMTEDINELNVYTPIKEWGSGDLNALYRELQGHKIQKFGPACNLKHVHQIWADANRINNSGGLSKSMARIGLLWEGQGKHQADIDALNTARLHNELIVKFKG